MDNSAAVYDILCNEEAWQWDVFDGHNLVFYRDGTGEVRAFKKSHLYAYPQLLFAHR
jgi:hypothetical protein